MPAVESAVSASAVPVSIDTAKPEVARRALESGAAIVNSIRGGHEDPQIDELVAETGCGLVLMHMQGNPITMQDNPTYTDVTHEVIKSLAKRIEGLVELGVEKEQIAVDPGIGFGKTTRHNAELLCRLRELESLECAILIGTSRKRFLGKLQGSESADRLARRLRLAFGRSNKALRSFAFTTWRRFVRRYASGEPSRIMRRSPRKRKL